MPNSQVPFIRAFVQPIKDRWLVLTGSASEFPLEARFFHSISLGIIVLTIVYAFYNFFAGLYVGSFSSVLFTGVFLYEYSRSRYRRLSHHSLLFGVLGLLIFSVNYFTNSGIQGSTDLIWPVYLMMLLTICPYRQHLAWIIVYLVAFALVHLGAYLYPDLVSYPFRPGKGQLVDRITAFPIPVITISIVVILFRRSYDRERALASQRDTEKSRLLSILSHDLRAPFIQIQQYLSILSDPDLSATYRKEMEHTLRETNDQTLEMLTNLLYWSRSQLEGATVHITQLALSETLANTLAITAALAAQKNITLEKQIDPSIRVNGDADMLQLIVRNLLQNAVKFTPEGGNIRIAAEQDGHIARLSVRDNGKGIAPEQLNTLFSGNTDPSYGTAGEKGVGLGLLLCREFVERQGGRIIAESIPGEGSTFTIELPLA